MGFVSPTVAKAQSLNLPTWMANASSVGMSRKKKQKQKTPIWICPTSTKFWGRFWKIYLRKKKKLDVQIQSCLEHGMCTFRDFIFFTTKMLKPYRNSSSYLPPPPDVTSLMPGRTDRYHHPCSGCRGDFTQTAPKPHYFENAPLGGFLGNPCLPGFL